MSFKAIALFDKSWNLDMDCGKYANLNFFMIFHTINHRITTFFKQIFIIFSKINPVKTEYFFQFMLIC